MNSREYDEKYGLEPDPAVDETTMWRGGMGSQPTTGFYSPTQQKLSPSAPSSSSGGTSRASSGGTTKLAMPTVPKNYAPMSLKLPTYKTPVYEEAVMGEMPTFAAPTYDESAIAKKTQKYAAPGVRKLRGAVQESMARNFDNPNVKSMTLKSALAGYGEGLESVMSGAGKQASAEYAQEYAYKYKESGMNYQTAVQAVRDKYAGQTAAKSAKFQAELNAVNTVYQAEIAKAQFDANEQTKKQMFDAIWDSYEGKSGSGGSSSGGSFSAVPYTYGSIAAGFGR